MRQPIEFQNSLRYRLAGWWDTPGDGAWPAVVLAHDSGSDRDNPDDAAVVELLLARGIAALRFDFTGCGESQGEAQDVIPAQMTDDLLWALEYAIRRPECTGSVGIYGTGSGGRAAIQVAIESSILAAVVLRHPVVNGLYRYAGIITSPTLILETVTVPAASQRLFDALECTRKQVLLPADGGGYAAAEAADWFAEHFAEVREVLASQP